MNTIIVTAGSLKVSQSIISTYAAPSTDAQQQSLLICKITYSLSFSLIKKSNKIDANQNKQYTYLYTYEKNV